MAETMSAAGQSLLVREIHEAVAEEAAQNLAEGRVLLFQLYHYETQQNIKIYSDGSVKGIDPGEWLVADTLSSLQSLSSLLPAALSPTATETSDANGLEQGSPS
jgi:hypothetical protein